MFSGVLGLDFAFHRLKHQQELIVLCEDELEARGLS
jgi:hypothetical protein